MFTSKFRKFNGFDEGFRSDNPGLTRPLYVNSSWIRQTQWSRLVIRRLRCVILISRSSRAEVFCKKGVLGNFTKFTGKQLCQSLFSNKVAGLRPPFTEYLWWLLLTVLSFSSYFNTFSTIAFSNKSACVKPVLVFYY